METLRLQAINVNVSSLVLATLIKCGQWGRDVTETFPETQCLHWPNKTLTPPTMPLIQLQGQRILRFPRPQRRSNPRWGCMRLGTRL